MKEQSYKNHVRYYPAHHFIFYPLLLACITGVVYAVFEYPASRYLWMAILACLVLIGWLSFMLRQHYALTLQNRIVRLEMRVRYFQLTGRRFDDLERQLRFGQIAALRFAGDDELPALAEKAASEQMDPTTIKKAIRHWYPDHMRV